jgi:hypothetical protein
MARLHAYTLAPELPQLSADLYQRIVETSREGQGSTLTVWLPLGPA